jgi:NUMOD4 motif
MEHWRTIAAFPAYAVSDMGRVQRQKTGRIIQSSPTGRDYLQVGLYNHGKRLGCRVARLVATAFVPNPQNLPQVNHKDGQRHNNTKDNLEWTTQSGNMKHAYGTGLQAPLPSAKHGMAKLTDAQVLHIRQRLQRGIYQRRIAEEMGVCQSLISMINRSKIWKHI